MELFISPAIKTLIDLALSEDLINHDLTTLFTIDGELETSAKIVAKEPLVFCGAPIIPAILEKVDSDLTYKIAVSDGTYVEAGTTCITLSGKAHGLLIAERLMLNFIQRLSGIATQTRAYVDALNNPDIKLVDTRKTLPGFRALDKYAVRMGGAYNHRMGLSDGILIKENHIRSEGSITDAVTKVLQNAPHTMKIECEVTDLHELKEAIDAGADIVMLDNMDIPTMEEAIRISDGRVLLEVSGNVTIERLPALGELNIDIISSGALTHSVKAADLSMLFAK